MKAWFVFTEEWGELIHAETAGKAKSMIMAEFGVDEYIWLSARRVPRLDDKAFTYKNLTEANWHYYDEDGELLKVIDYYNVCKCELCSGKET